jgi:hypothetical protein
MLRRTVPADNHSLFNICRKTGIAQRETCGFVFLLHNHGGDFDKKRRAIALPIIDNDT